MNRYHGKLWKWGLSHVSIEPDESILDVGCGGGKTIQVMAQISPEVRVIGIDYSDDMVKMAQRLNRRLIESGRVEIMHGTVSSLPFSDETFDLVTAFETYYFWPDLVGDLKEVNRVLRPRGSFLIVNEQYKDDRSDKFEERNARYVAACRMHHHTPEEIHELLIEAGFLPVEIDTLPERNYLAAIATKP